MNVKQYSRAHIISVPYGALNLRTYPTEQTIKEGKILFINIFFKE
jgi:hypothetical protein